MQEQRAQQDLQVQQGLAVRLVPLVQQDQLDQQDLRVQLVRVVQA